MKQSQNDKIRIWLLSGHTITQMQALNKWGVGCLHSRITNLRDEGLYIITDMIKIKNRYGEYSRVARYKRPQI